VNLKSLKIGLKSSQMLERQNLELHDKLQILQTELIQKNNELSELKESNLQIIDLREREKEKFIKEEAWFNAELSEVNFKLKEG
jgi:hypothetical protein